MFTSACLHSAKAHFKGHGHLEDEVKMIQYHCHIKVKLKKFLFSVGCWVLTERHFCSPIGLHDTAGNYIMLLNFPLVFLLQAKRIEHSSRGK